MDILYDLFFDYTLRTVALGTAVIGVVSGVLGSFAFLRRQSLLGDAISHAALPGVVIAFLLTERRDSTVLMLGALVAGWLGTLLVLSIVRNTRIKEDSAIGLTLSVFFGFGLMLLTYAQRASTARQAGLDRFLFGQAAALVQRDVILMAAIGTIALLLVFIFWKEFKLVSFDSEFAATLGFPVRIVDILLTTLLVVAVVIGLQAVGVILMSAMVVAPAAGARQWTDRLDVMVVIAAVFGAVSSVIGAVVSSTTPGLSTGPVIVLVVSTMAVLSLFFAAKRGLFWDWLRRRRNRSQMLRNTVLSDLYRLEQQHPDDVRGHSAETLSAMAASHNVSATLANLADDNLVDKSDNDHWILTNAGIREARALLEETESSQNSLIDNDMEQS